MVHYASRSDLMRAITSSSQKQRLTSRYSQRAQAPVADLKRSAKKMDPIETTRFRLVPLSANHAEGLFGALSSPDVYRYIPGDAPKDVSSLASRYRYLESRRSPDGSEVWLNWAICVPSDARLVGVVEVTLRSGGRA